MATLTTPSDFLAYVVLATRGGIADAANPAFALEGCADSLLLGIASGEIDAVLLAKIKLYQRGLDRSGHWVGFDAAAVAWGFGDIEKAIPSPAILGENPSGEKQP